MDIAKSLLAIILLPLLLALFIRARFSGISRRIQPKPPLQPCTAVF